MDNIFTGLYYRLDERGLASTCVVHSAFLIDHTLR